MIHLVRRHPSSSHAILLALLLLLTIPAQPEDGSAAWLRYAPVPAPARFARIPSSIFVAGDSPAERSAASELQRGLTSMLGRPFVLESVHHGPAIVLGTQSELTPAAHTPPMPLESYSITFPRSGPSSSLTLTGGSPAAVLYAAFHLLEEVAAAQPIPASETQTPSAPIRWTDEWDNMNGTIERGYAGPSIFFAGGHVRQDLSRASAYARLLASVGINGCNVNNVNADLDVLTPAHLTEFARLAGVFRPWGIRLALSVDLSSPQSVGGLSTFDPLDPAVIAWWQARVDEIYRLIPDFAGFTVKADSEGRAGPSQYGRSPADAANVLARALRPHAGVVLYRGFVYNHHLDWRDPKADRARAGFDNFAALDGTFEPNVIIQIKHGPIDFQAREPVSPLFAALQHTSQAIELQTTQEYTGQQRHMVWLPAMWKWVLDTDLRVGGHPTPVSSIVSGQAFHQPSGGYVSVVNVGMEPNWLHHPMALANLYGFAKLAWNPAESLDRILDTWTRLTWGNDPEVVRTITGMQQSSWLIYEGYTGPNGMGTLTDILGVHFGPGIESAEHNGWGQWFRAQPGGIGMDRTLATGTGYIAQYPPQLAAQYENLATCPDDLLLFFHHVPYAYRLHSGQTLVQSIYDTHYTAAIAAGQYEASWQGLRDRVDPERFHLVAALLEFQAGHAIEWRDSINQWFQHTSGIDDAHHRVGHDPNRIEAEDMHPVGYLPVQISPFETASGGRAMVCPVAAGCSLETVLQRPAGVYNIAVQYFDLRTGISHYTLLVNDREVAAWDADATLPPAVVRPIMDGQTSTRFTARSVHLKPGDRLQLRGIPASQSAPATRDEDPAGASPVHTGLSATAELAPVDYIEIGPGGPVTPQ